MLAGVGRRGPAGMWGRFGQVFGGLAAESGSGAVVPRINRAEFRELGVRGKSGLGRFGAQNACAPDFLREFGA